MIKHMCNRNIPRRRERENGAENIFEVIIVEYFPNLMKDKSVLVQDLYNQLQQMRKSRDKAHHGKLLEAKDKE